MKYRRLMSLFCAVVLIVAQCSIPAYSIESDFDSKTVDSEPNKIITLSQDDFENVTVISKQYDKTTKAEVDFSNLILSGLYEGDDVNLTADAEFEDENAGINKSVRLTNLGLSGNNAEEYLLNLSFDADKEPIILYNGEITPKEIHIDTSNIGLFDKNIKVPYKVTDDWDINWNDIIDGDNINKIGDLFVEEKDGKYVYSADNISVGNDNYKIVLNENDVPKFDEVIIPNIAVESTAIIAKINEDDSTILKYHDIGITANGSVAVTVTAVTNNETDEITFQLIDEDGVPFGENVIVKKEQCEEIEIGGKTAYCYKAVFNFEMPDEKKKKIFNIGCGVSDGTNYANETLNFKLDKDSEEFTDTLILDGNSPEIDQDKGIKISYDNNKKELHAEGYFNDDLSGIASIKYKFDDEDEYSDVKINTHDDEQTQVNFSFSKKYKDLKSNVGRHLLQIQAIDYAGNELNDIKGYFCDENEGQDTKAPVIKSIDVKSVESRKKLDKILSVISFGNYSKEYLCLTLSVEDESESKCLGGVSSVELLDGKTQLKLSDEPNDNGNYVFEFDKEVKIENFKIRIKDKFNNSKTISVKEALQSSAAAEMEDKSVDWKTLESDSWVMDKKSPAISVSYGIYQDVNTEKYYNINHLQKDASIDIKITDNYALKEYIVEQKNNNSWTTVYSSGDYSEIQTSADYKIQVSGLSTGSYNYRIKAYDYAGNDVSQEEINFHIDKNVPNGNIEVISPKPVIIDNTLWINKEDVKDNKLTFRLYPQGNGSDFEQFDFYVNNSKKPVHSENNVNYDKQKRAYVDFNLDLDEVSADTQEYNIKVEYKSVSGNKGSSFLNVKMDTEKPSVEKFTVEKKKNFTKAVLNVLTFGVFCNDASSLIFSAEVKDSQYDVGIDSVYIRFKGLSEEQEMKFSSDGKYTYEFPDNTKLFQSDIEIRVCDKIGKESIDSPNINNLENNGGVSEKCFAMIETNQPKVILDVPNGDGVQRNDKQIWYNRDKSIALTVQDLDSGLRAVNVTVNGSKITVESNDTPLPTVKSTSSNRNRDNTSHTFIFSSETLSGAKDGNYEINVSVIDNAGNVKNVSNTYHRDTQKPEITNFHFSKKSADGVEDVNKFIKKLNYGYFFQTDVTVAVTVKDSGNTSGFDKVIFKLIPTETCDVPLKTEQEIAIDDKGNASVDIPEGFKGQVYATAYDKTGNYSMEVTPRAFVVEHNAPKITIQPLPDNSSKTDDKGNKLYTSKVKFKVTVTDTQSGLRKVSYSQKSDIDSYETIDVPVYENENVSVSSKLKNGWRIEKVDENLITQISQTFTFEKDDKNVFMTFYAEDRSKNTALGQTEKFTIDSVSPEVTKFYFDAADAEKQTENKDGELQTAPQKLEYGYFFKSEFVLTAAFDDKKPSSGLDKAVFRLVSSETKETDDMPQFNEKDNQKTYNVNTASEPEKKKEICREVKIENKQAYCRIPKGFKGQIYVQAFDRANNASDDVTSRAFVVEDSVPQISIEPLPDNLSKTDDLGNKLYTSKVQFKVTISDKKSGLKEAAFTKSSDLTEKKDVIKTEVKIKDASNSLENGWNIEETDANLITEISQVFIFDNDDKNIFMTFDSVDKSLNKTDLKKTEKFTIDTVAPQILKYSFEPATEDDISDTETFIEELEYGFYFKKDFNASVLSDDATPTSGLDKVVFRMVSYENGEQSNEEIVEAAIENKKAVCLVQAGFKGQIYAQSLDRGANKSEEETPQAFVIDETAPVIKIDPLPSTSYTDSEGNKLYTSSVDFKVTVTDEKAGLKQLVYSKSSEKNSHNDVVTAIGNTRGYDDNATLENGWEIVKTDRNLVTEVSQIFHFSEDDNNITMNFSAEDRAHNLSDTFSSERFTIDTINPKVVISNPVSPVNGMYYQDSTTFTITVTERNFNADLMESKVENSYTSAVPAVKFSPAGANVYTASVTFPEGDYIFSFTGEDRGGHKTEIQADRADYTTTAFSADFKVDATEPKLETNFDEFGKHDDSEIYFNTSKTVEITVNEHNFDKNSFDIVKLESKASGTPHNKDDAEWFEISFDSKWEKEKTQDDVYILKIPLEENAVYKVSVEPIDLSGKRAKKTESAIFEIDTVSPELYSRSDKTINDKDFVTSPYCEVFDEKKKDAPSPVVEFEDLNFDHIEVEATVYLPEYKNGMEYGEVVPDGLSEKLTCNVDKKEFSIPKQSFEKDGVYALTYVAVDKAGNKSKPVNDTYFKMINTDVLAYLYHSSKTDGTGYYSLMDDSGKAISKKATDFQDLDIFVIKKKTEDNKNKEQEEQVGNIMIRDDDNEYSPKDYIQPNEEKISETSVLTKNRLPSSYFSDTFKDDSLDKRMYLSVSIHDNAYLDLAALHIDNERPSATLPEHFVSWHNYMFTNEVTIELSNITETLNEELCKVYECPRGKERVEIPFTYSKENKTLSFVLDKGLHNIDITLADEAKNEWDINRVRYLRVGNFRLYLGIGITALIAGAVVMINLLKKRGTISK